MEDIRDHHPEPRADEAEWMAESAVGLVVRAVALAGLALSLGWGASAFLDQAAHAPPVVAESSR